MQKRNIEIIGNTNESDKKAIGIITGDKEVMIHIGPYGKYMKYNGKNIKIPQKDNYSLEDLIRYIQ